MNSVSAYVRAIRGPILLVTAGSLLALDQRGSYPFWRMWPVLLVVLGAMTLLERSLGQASEGGPQQ